MKVLLRRLARRRLETSLMVAQIALGGVFCLGAVSWLLWQVLEPLPVRDVDRLVLLSGLATVESSDPVEGWGRMKSLERLASNAMAAAAVVDAGGRRTEVPMAMVSPGFFRTLGADLGAGREFLPEEERRGAPVAVHQRCGSALVVRIAGGCSGGAARISGRPLLVRSAVLAAAAALSLLMLALEIFSATARSAGARAGEAGVRMALGATPLDIVGWLQKDALLACFVGLAAGGAASVFLRGLTAVELIDVPRFDPAATAAAAALVLASVLLSALPPSLLLARRPPMEILRQL